MRNTTSLRRLRVVLLPGLDGTGRLLAAFARAAPPWARPEVLALPDAPLAYAAIAARLAPAARLDGDTVLVAESFSGPVAALLAAERAPRALVLCNSFVAPPVRLPLAAPLCTLAAAVTPRAVRCPPPAFAVRRWLVGRDAPEALVAAVRDAVASVPTALIAHRLHEVLRADAGGALARVTAPVLDLRGADDRLVGAESAAAVSRAAAGRMTRAVLAGPHLLLQARPDAAWGAIAGWLMAPDADGA